MDLRWAAYIGSTFLAALSLAPVTMFRAAPEKAPPPASASVPPAVLRQSAPALLDMERHTARLRTYLTDGPLPRAPRRDPFHFAERRRAPAPVHALPDAPVFTPPAPPRPPLTLVGMAERQVGDDTVRTAILNGFGDVHLVTVGDRIADRFTVRAIGINVVELEDRESQSVLRLELVPTGR